jgi:hypothetical protein
MASFGMQRGSFLLVLGICLLVLPGRAVAFGAGNIPSIAQVWHVPFARTTLNLNLTWSS